jgi:hypothetical protein
MINRLPHPNCTRYHHMSSRDVRIVCLRLEEGVLSPLDCPDQTLQSSCSRNTNITVPNYLPSTIHKNSDRTSQQTVCVTISKKRRLECFRAIFAVCCESLAVLTNVKRLSLSAPWWHIGRVEVWLHLFTASARDRGKWSTTRPSRFAAGKEARYQLNMRLGGPQRRSRHFGDKKTLSPLPEFEPRHVQ